MKDTQCVLSAQKEHVVCQTSYAYSLLMRANKHCSGITGLSGPTTTAFFMYVYI